MIHRRVDGGDINRRNRRTRKGIITVVVLGPLSRGEGDERVFKGDPLRGRIKTQFVCTWVLEHL